MKYVYPDLFMVNLQFMLMFNWLGDELAFHFIYSSMLLFGCI